MLHGNNSRTSFEGKEPCIWVWVTGPKFSKQLARGFLYTQFELEVHGGCGFKAPVDWDRHRVVVFRRADQKLLVLWVHDMSLFLTKKIFGSL